LIIFARIKNERMKKISLFIIILAAVSLSLSAIQPYYKMEVRSGSIGEMAEIVRTKLAEGGFEILGEYYPGDTDHLYVLAFTSDELIQLASEGTDQGLMASVMKVGITHYDGKVTVSLINPEYLFYAYLRSKMDISSVRLGVEELSEKVLDAMSFEGTIPSGFGGDVSAEDLKKYRYMPAMPTFDKPVELNTFRSFNEGLEVIRTNLDSGKGRTEKVFEQIISDKKVAIFGVGLYDQAKGESHFLPIIGEDNVAAMPYEIILIDKKAIMLHGRYRFALHWPELKMSTFTKIMSSPGDVEDFLKALTEE
jgi:hypothetical protein